MIIDLEGFIRTETPVWQELETRLAQRDDVPDRAMTYTEIRRFHYLYQRTASGLAKIATFSSEPQLHTYLESLVARAYGEVYDLRDRPRHGSPRHWLMRTLPRTFRRRRRAFALSLGILLLGVLFGIGAMTLDPSAKAVLIPFSNLRGSPTQRVHMEEQGKGIKRLEGHMGTFAATLMTHNTRVAIFTMALGVTFGLGTAVMLFYNGVILGAVALDYVRAGEGVFLTGWLLPHGAVEISAILIAGQAAFVLAGAMIGRGRPVAFRTRLREVSADVVTLMAGVALMLVWAGLVEAFFSQIHAPYLPYGIKIGVGVVELAVLTTFYGLTGRGDPIGETTDDTKTSEAQNSKN